MLFIAIIVFYELARTGGGDTLLRALPILPCSTGPEPKERTCTDKLNHTLLFKYLSESKASCAIKF
jgi:hypothetical protein